MRPCQIHDGESESGHNGIHEPEPRRNEDKAELERLGDAADYGGDRAGHQDARDPCPVFGLCTVIHRERDCGHGEDLQQEEPVHEIADRDGHVVRELRKEDELVAVYDLPRAVHVLARLQPECRPPDVVHAERDREALDEAEHEACDARIAVLQEDGERVELLLNRRPDDAHDRTH